MAGEKVVTFSKTGETSVDIWCTKLDHDFQKALVEVAIPRLRLGDGFQDDSDAWIIDLGRVKEHIQIAGFLVDEVDNEPTTYTAFRKKALLNTLMNKMGVTLTWGTTNATTKVGNIQKFTTTETAGKVTDGAGSTEQERVLAIIIRFIVGTDK